MLVHTFRHIPGIGSATERQLWRAGMHTWQQLEPGHRLLCRINRKELATVLKASETALAVKDPVYFTNLLPANEAWRIFPDFRTQTAYLDIETSGLGNDCEITTIALYDGTRVRTYVNGRNLETFPADLNQYSVLVTYNGRSFDIPFIERYFRIRVNQAQIDLRYVLAHLGCRGGLKGCEHQFGINRGLLDGIDGACAIPLWREYDRYGNESALETLLAYNIEDTVNLERLLVEAFNRSIEQTPFAGEGILPYPVPPPLYHQPDPQIIRLLRARND